MLNLYVNLGDIGHLYDVESFPSVWNVTSFEQIYFLAIFKGFSPVDFVHFLLNLLLGTVSFIAIVNELFTFIF